MNTNTNRIRTAVAGIALTVSIGLLAGCGGGGSTDTTGSPSTTSTTSTTAVPPDSAVPVIATAKVSNLDIFASPDDPQPVQQLHSLPDYPLVVLVESASQNDRIQVALPTRPNGSTGWVRTNDVTTSQVPYRLEVDLSDHKLTVYEVTNVLFETTVAVGTQDTPTPAGRFYVTDLIQPPNPDGAYGPYVFGLSAHSEVLDQFGGGDGQVGIHGTNQPELLGTDVSHGCIRLANADILRLAGILSLGTPVEIRA